MVTTLTAGSVSTQNLQITGGSTNFVTAGTGQTLKRFTNAAGMTGNALVAGTGLKVCDITATKTFYITDIYIYASTGGNMELTENGAGGTPIFIGQALTTPQKITFNTPLAFSNTNIYLDLTNNATVLYTITGWEQ